jgi:hypothetical protein
MLRRCLAIALFAAVTVSVFAQDVPLTNWTVPPYHASRASGGLTTMTDITSPRAFIGIQPCRVADTRGLGAPITGGIFANSEARNWTVWGICGIPSGADAVSVNFSVVSPAGTPAGAFLLAWPTGQAAPPTAIMTYGPGATILSNAAIVPLNASGQMTVNVSHSTQIVMDVNGYFSDTLQNTGNYFKLTSATAFPNATLVAENTSTGAGAAAIQGVITSTAAGSSSVAVRGINNNNINNNGIGVWGSHAGAGWGVSGTSQTGFGVIGQTFGSLGIGVLGVTASTENNNAGVWGRDGGPSFAGAGLSAGVRGESTSGSGVLGLLANDTLAGEAVNGSRLNSSGGLLSGGRLGYEPTIGVFFQNGLAGTGMKSFVEPHPTDASKAIRYVSLEGNEAGTYFRGRGKFRNGIAVIEIPDDFRMVTDSEGLSIQVTPIGERATVAVVSIGLERIVVRGSRNVEFFYTVNGVRRAYKNVQTIVENRKFFVPDSPEAKLPLYLSADEKQRLVDNGTYKADGSVNLETARRLGWNKEWEKRNPPVALPAQRDPGN